MPAVHVESADAAERPVSVALSVNAELAFSPVCGGRTHCASVSRNDCTECRAGMTCNECLH